MPFSFLPSVDLGDVVGLDYDFVPETTHFLQLERPRACLDLMLDFLRRQKLAQGILKGDSVGASGTVSGRKARAFPVANFAGSATLKMSRSSHGA